jgi:hypothetical protein
MSRPTGNYFWPANDPHKAHDKKKKHENSQFTKGSQILKSKNLQRKHATVSGMAKVTFVMGHHNNKGVVLIH